MAVLALVFYLIYKDMRLRGVNPYLSSTVLYLGALAARSRFTERPHIFEYLFVALFIYILDLYRLRGKNYLWLLILFQTCWVNIHGSFLLGPLIIAIYIVGIVLENVVAREAKLNPLLSVQNRVAVLTGIFVAVCAVNIINPYGWKIIHFLESFAGKKILISSIFEWEPTRFSQFFSVFGLLFITGIIFFVLNLKNIDFTDLLLFSLFAYLSIRAYRFTALFAVSTASVIAWNCQSLISKHPFINNKRYILGWLCLTLLIIVTVNGLRKSSYIFFGLGAAPVFPAKACDFIEKIEVQGNMYNTYNFGGYLIWRFFPNKKVFIDSRAEIYADDFLDDFMGNPEPKNLYSVLDKYDINYAIIEYKNNSKSLPDGIVQWILTDKNTWILVYRDDLSRIYFRNTENNQELIRSYGLSAIEENIRFY